MSDIFFLYGAGGHAKVILDILRAKNVRVDCVFDDNAELSEFCGLPVVRRENLTAGTGIISIGKNEVRQKIAEALNACGSIRFATAIHPSTVISPSATIGEGTVAMPGALVNAGARIGKHCILNTGVSIDHDCTIGDFVHVAPHATLCGNISVGAGAWLGAGATIIQGVSVGENAFVGAGAVVIKDVPANAVVAGVPAKILKYKQLPPPSWRNQIFFRNVPFCSGSERSVA